jgi:P4 family phage/plasmid primase-like protien
MTPLEAARDWTKRGYYVVPIPFRQKRPNIDDWPNLRIEENDLPRYFNGAQQNLGVLLGDEDGSADVDPDCREALAAWPAFAIETGLVFGRVSKPASHWFYRSDPPIRTKKYVDPIDKATIIELRGLASDGKIGLQTIVPPSIHKNGEEIRFELGRDGDPANVVAEVLVHAVAKTAAAALFAKHWPEAGHGRHNTELAIAGALAGAGWPVDEARAFVLATYRSVPDHDRGALGRVAKSIEDTYQKHAQGVAATGVPTLAELIGKKIVSIGLRWLGIDQGPPASGHTLPSGHRVFEAVSGAYPDLIWQHFSDYGNAQRLIALYGDRLRYCHDMNTWLVYDGKRWAVDHADRARDIAQQTLLEFARQALASGNEAASKSAGRCLNSNRITCALREAQPHLAIKPTDLDTDPNLLNCLNGTLDPRSGVIRPHRPEDFITKLVHFEYRPEAECPQLLTFLYRIMGAGPDASEPETERADRLVNYLQKCFGYALTGDVTEKAVFCFFGSGNNGKTTLLETIRFVLSEYSTQVLIDTLMQHHSRESNASLADLGDLRSARFVTTSETEEGQRLALSKLKYLTQGMGQIKTCQKYQNPIVFTATHKLFLDANHKPIVRGGEQAVWNRLKPVPFTMTIPPGEIDTGLLDKLKSEAEGVFTWMVKGCQRWRREGLGDPPEVAEASAVWQAESDHFPIFLADKCVLEPHAWVPVANLWSSYQTWCQENNERLEMKKTTFDGRLEKIGCRRGKNPKGDVRAWIGIRFRTTNDEAGR